MYIKKILITILIVFFATTILAHEGHKKKKPVIKPDTLTIVGKDTIAINGIPMGKFMAAQHSEADEEHLENIEEEENEVKEVTFGAAFEHLHNKLIHFPIALTIISFLLLLAGYKENKYLSAIKIIVPFAALVTIVTVLTGQAQAEPFEGTLTYGLVETHELLGFGVLASLILWSVVLYVKKLEKLVWLFAILTISLVSLAGLYGGVIAH